MNLESRIRDLFPPAQRDRRGDTIWDIAEKTDELLTLISESDCEVTLRLLNENDRSVLAYRLGDETEPLVRLDDRYAYYLRVLMAHLSTRLSESVGTDPTPYEGSGVLEVDGRKVGITFCNQPGNSCLHLAPVPSTGRDVRRLAAVA